MDVVTATKLNTILLVDDDEATLLINKLIIKKAGLTDITINTAREGGEALDYLDDAFAGTSDEKPIPQLIFLDINMPALDGWDFLEDYKNLPQEQQEKIKIVMLTTSLNPDDEERALNTKEIDMFMRKPLTVENIHHVVTTFFAE